MKKNMVKTILVCGICAVTAVSTVSFAAEIYRSPSVVRTENQGPGVELEQNEQVWMDVPVRMWGSMKAFDGTFFSIDNQAQGGYQGEVLLTVSEETKILDAVTGMPVKKEDVKAGAAEAYTSQIMTMSLPPQTPAKLILTNIPADYSVPQYAVIQSCEKNADGTYTLEASDKRTYTIKADAEIVPYLTRNIVGFQDLTEGKAVLIWNGMDQKAEKVMVFPG